MNVKQFAIIEFAFEEFKWVSEAVWMIQTKEITKLFQRTLEWDSLDRWVKTLEANMGVYGLGSGASSQVEGWLVVIEDNQRQLGDTVKDLTIEVKDVMETFQLEMSELVATVKVVMMALGNSFQEDGASEWRGKAKVLDPRPYVGEQDAQNLENFLFNMEQYFLASSIDSEECQLNKVTMFLIDAAKF